MNACNRSRFLGCYLLLCVAYQAGIYFCSSFLQPPSVVFGDRFEGISWFYFANPREVFFIISRSSLLYWASAAWLIAIAVALIIKPRDIKALRAYVLVELALLVLELASLLLSVFLRFDIGNRNSVTRDFQLHTTAAVVLFFSVLPCLYGLWILRKRSSER
jgi:hypothetical protein